ncbi:MAG TPA: FAD-binding protein, partial [Candidatus Tumulicola sp.]
MTSIERAIPQSEGELSATLASANREQRPLRIVGGDTLRGTGARPPIDYAIVTTGIGGIVDFEPDDLTVAALAGTRLDLLAQTLAQRGQLQAFDAPLPAEATV